MLHWDEMHPYNAVHVARVPGLLNPEQLRCSLNSVLEASGLGRLALDSEKSVYSFARGAGTCDVSIIAGVNDVTHALRAQVEQELNAPFVRNQSFTPFRFFAVPAADSFFLGLVYFHAMADAESIVFLLRSLVRCYVKQSPPAVEEFNRYPDGNAHLLRRYAGVVVRKLLAMPGQMRQLRRSHRPRYCEPGDLTNGFRYFSVSAEHLRGLVAASKQWGVTVNDLLLALLLKSVSPLSADRTKARRRRKISVGCIVNLRREFGIDSARTFGLFLGSLIVTHSVGGGVSLPELAGDIRQQTAAYKRHRLYLATPLELGLGRFVLRFFSPARRRRFYQKNYPLWGGLTNMNLNSIWPTDEDGLLDYFRGVSTGPVTPLVFSVTTVWDHANVGLSYRTTVFSLRDIEGVQGQFMQQLEQLPSLA